MNNTTPTLKQAQKLEALIAQVREQGLETNLIKPSYIGYLVNMESAVMRIFRKQQITTKGE